MGFEPMMECNPHTRLAGDYLPSQVCDNKDKLVIVCVIVLQIASKCTESITVV